MTRATTFDYVLIQLSLIFLKPTHISSIDSAWPQRSRPRGWPAASASATQHSLLLSAPPTLPELGLDVRFPTRLPALVLGLVGPVVGWLDGMTVGWLDGFE